jgi:tetratricopeptide (TPR) repeat protein
VHARTISLESGRELPVVNEEDDLSRIFELFDRVSSGVAKTAGRTSTAPHGVAPLSLEAFENYVKGLVATTPAAEQRFLESALRLAPADPRILLALWSVYTGETEYDKALGAANAVPADSPSYRRARFDVALSLIDLKRYDGAFKELTSLGAGRPSSAVSNALGIVQLRRGATPAGTSPATTYFKRAVDAEPDNTDYLFNLGYAHALTQNSTEALSWLRESVRFDAANGDAHLVMAELLRAMGRTAESQREADLARLLGTSRDVTTQAGRVPAGLERVVSDLDDVSRPRLSVPAAGRTDERATAAFHLARARDLIAAHNDHEATTELRQAIYLSPYEDEPHLLLGRIYRRAGRVNDAIDEFKVALWARESAEAHIALGDALLDSGDREGARREATRATAMAPGSAEARDLARRVQ